MVIEDDTDIRETMVYALEQEGFVVVASEDSRILKHIHQHNPDMILLDNWLSDWKSDASGEQLSKQLKSDPTTKHIPIVIVSAVSNIKDIAESGLADDFLRKPFDLKDLIWIVQRFTADKV